MLAMIPAEPQGPVSRRPGSRVDAGRLWAGGLATALVAALIAAVGILIARGIFDVPVLAPEGDGVWGDASTAWYAAAAAICALLATALMHLLLTFTPRSILFFGWVMFLATTLAVLAPFSTGASTAAKVATGLINLVLGVAIGSLVTGTARSARRVVPPDMAPNVYGRPRG
jgi:Na+/phosphate symporter